MKNKDKPLEAKIVDEQVVIRIGVETLAFCALAKNGGRMSENLRISNAKKFAEDMISELMREEENGETLLTEALDKAIEKAVDGGSTAVFELKRKPRQL